EAWGVQGQEATEGRIGVGFIERDDDPALCVDPLVDLKAPLARNERLERAGHAVGTRPRAPAELERVAETARGDEPYARHLALEHGVGGGRRTMDDEIKCAGRHGRLRDCRQYAVGLIG